MWKKWICTEQPNFVRLTDFGTHLNDGYTVDKGHGTELNPEKEVGAWRDPTYVSHFKVLFFSNYGYLVTSKKIILRFLIDIIK